ncbi:MAG: hypothetical protein HFJ91_01780 [Muribaculaceae bacterium]|nr:hypothetical protein [Muribaculaceae bacterium]
MIRIWLRRRWRARGHGIHSPFAYRMVTSVLRERGRYYGYEVLEKRCGEDVRWLKLVFRIVCALEPGSVGGPLTAGEAEAVRMADSRAELTGDGIDADLTVADGLSVSPAYPAQGRALLVRRTDSQERMEYLCGMPEGMSFTNGRVLLVVNRRGVPRQDFDTSF